MKGFKDKNIQNQKLDYNSDPLSNFTSNNDDIDGNSDINKQKIKKYGWKLCGGRGDLPGEV